MALRRCYTRFRVLPCRYSGRKICRNCTPNVAYLDRKEASNHIRQSEAEWEKPKLLDLRTRSSFVSGGQLDVQHPLINGQSAMPDLRDATFMDKIGSEVEKLGPLNDREHVNMGESGGIVALIPASKQEVQAQKSDRATIANSSSRDSWMKWLGQWKQTISDGLKHYWLGAQLLWVDIKISSRLLLNVIHGESLSRRERQQLRRTTTDIFRLVPFAVIIIVPFMEFLLPLILKLFPNILPSTFQDKAKEKELAKQRANARLQYVRFLQDIVSEMAKEIKTKGVGEMQKTAEDLDVFMGKVHRGEAVTNEDILLFAKLFNDELTLDNISRPRIVNMCKYMGIKPYGTNAYLRYILHSKLS